MARLYSIKSILFWAFFAKSSFAGRWSNPRRKNHARIIRTFFIGINSKGIPPDNQFPRQNWDSPPIDLNVSIMISHGRQSVTENSRNLNRIPPKPESSHVCIIGAGPAGLSAACYLKDRGYERITVLERKSVPGGKCRSFIYNDRPYELGAVFGTPNYHATLGLMERAGVPPSLSAKQKKSRATKDLIDRGYYSFDTIIPDYFSYAEVIQLLGQILKYRKLAKNYPRLYFPGLDNISPELSDPFSRWVKKYGMQRLAKMIEIPCTTFGYGYFDEIPAAYVLKYMDVPNVTSLILRRNHFKWKDGAQSLWEKISQEFDVRYDIEITNISRTDMVTVETTAGSLTFDVLILTSPLDEALGFLDTAGEE